MLTAEQGWFFEKQKEGFRRHGYKIQSKLLLATNYGVAQERKRVFIVGVRNDVEDFEYEFPLPTHGEDAGTPFAVLHDVIGNLATKDDDAYCQKEFHGHFLTRNRKRSWDEPSYTIVAHASHVPLHPDGEPMKWVGKDKYIPPVNYRRLSWRECAAIQGLPRRIKVDGGLFAKYRVVGNAVPPAFGNASSNPLRVGQTSLNKTASISGGCVFSGFNFYGCGVAAGAGVGAGVGAWLPPWSGGKTPSRNSPRTPALAGSLAGHSRSAAFWMVKINS